MDAKAKVEISDLVLKSAGSLEARLADLIKEMSENEMFKSEDVDAFPVHNFNGFSGYNFWVCGSLVAQLHIASLTSGYYVFMRKVLLDESSETYEYYNHDGEFVYVSESLDGQTSYYNSINMDPTSAYINHLYNILLINYEAAEAGMGDSKRIGYVESLLNSFLRNPSTKIGAADGRRDPALLNILNEIHRVEMDPILSWDERQKVFSTLKQVRKKILRTKCRAHKFNILAYQGPVKLYDAKVRLDLFKKRPTNNIFGVFKKYTWGRILWFGGTVKNNLGLSIAMAIYTPFTFYFITQPMNPHAMYIVGKVRNAYVSLVKTLAQPLTSAEKPQIIVDADNIEDSVSLKQSAFRKRGAPAKLESWDERMSRFKAMNIAYEGNMIFAARIGRFEQMENQFMVPLTAESAWEEIERYLNDVNFALSFNKNLDARYRGFLEREQERALDMQIYIWKKIARFFADHPYMVVDQDDEQPVRDYYTGRAFIFMKRMTEKLSKLDLTATPQTHKLVMGLADKYQKMYKPGESVLESLEKNSKVFAQEDPLNSEELRDTYRMQWETLFLQQSKKQEAASFSLQTYTWSVKNAIWILQSIYSAKRQELGALTYKYNLNNPNTDDTKADRAITELYEAMLNMMTLEYTSIKKEIAANLKGDNEAELREALIRTLRDSFAERDRLFNNGSLAADGDNDKVRI